MNFQTNHGQKVALTGCRKSQETPAQSTDLQVAADNERLSSSKIILETG